MSRLGGWFRSSTSKVSSSNVSATSSTVDLAGRELADLEEAMAAAARIMNDDIDGAEEGLQKGNSAFHQLGMGVTTFMRSILGFEKDVMAEASTRLNNCENRAWADQKKAAKDHNASTSRIYAPGTEYILIQAEAQLMTAVVGVLHESLTEAIKGFYKLRKAYIALDGIMQAEARALGKEQPAANEPLKRTTTGDSMPGTFDDEEFVDLGSTNRTDNRDDGNRDDSDEFVDAKESQSGAQTPLEPLTKPSNGTAVQDMAEKTESLSLEPQRTVTAPPAPPPAGPIDDGPSPDLFTTPLDIFIHSGANMCFGLLLLLLSMVPPAFSRLLSIIGFRGDRARGVSMLWRSTHFNNINGAVSGLALLAYYNGLLGGADILPADDDFDADAEVIGYPRERCEALLATMKSRYPDSQLWRLEEGRLLGQKRRLAEAVALLSSGERSKMRQVAALNNFELSLDSMFVQDWDLMQQCFLRCVELNDWSHAMYYYMAACAEIERYRNQFHSPQRDETEMRRFKNKAEEYLRKAPTVAGRKRLLARQLPFEVFVTRKVAKWEERAKELKVDLADAVGVSPAMEMIYLWSGAKRMSDAELQRAMDHLEWERCTAEKSVVEKWKATPDEAAIRAVCESAILRVLLRFGEAREVLADVLKTDKSAFKGPSRDDWTLPAAHHEIAAIAWAECCRPDLREGAATTTATTTTNTTTATTTGAAIPDEETKVATAAEDAAEVKAYRRQKVDECQDHLDKLVAWEAYVLDARFGLRVQTGLETVRWFRKRMGWS